MQNIEFAITIGPAKLYLVFIKTILLILPSKFIKNPYFKKVRVCGGILISERAFFVQFNIKYLDYGFRNS